MWAKICQAFVVAVIGGAMLSITEVDAQSTVDGGASCESPTFNDAVILIREDLKDVKDLLRSNQQHRPPTESSDKKTSSRVFPIM